MGECVFDTPSVKVYVGYGDQPFTVYVNGERDRSFRWQDEAVGYAMDVAKDIGDAEQMKWDTCQLCHGDLENGYCPACGVRWHNAKERVMRKSASAKSEIERIIKEEWSDYDIVEVWNDVADYHSYERLYGNADLEELVNMNYEGSGMTPYEIIQDAKDLDTDCEYYYFNDLYGLTGTDDIDDVVDYGIIADWCIENDEDCDDDEIRAILDGEEREASRKVSVKRKVMKKRALDYNLRDEIIFGGKQEYMGGCAWFEHMTLDTAKRLVELGFLDPSDYQNESPTAGELIGFAEKYRGQEVEFGGYAVSPERDDVRVTLDTIVCQFSTSHELLDEAEELFGEDGEYPADDYRTNGNGFFAWWD